MLQVFGGDPIRNPLPPGSYGDLTAGGFMSFVTNVVKTLIVFAGIFAFVNLIIAGWQYLASNGDPKATAAAWSRIYMSLIGLVIMVASFVIAAIIGQLLFNNPMYILQPRIYGPGATAP
jgi:hypothetical protein